MLGHINVLNQAKQKSVCWAVTGNTEVSDRWSNLFPFQGKAGNWSVSSWLCSALQKIGTLARWFLYFLSGFIMNCAAGAFQLSSIFLIKEICPWNITELVRLWEERRSRSPYFVIFLMSLQLSSFLNENCIRWEVKISFLSLLTSIYRYR
jgi:hypothetical protein